MRSPVFVLLVLLGTSGCASLHMEPSDSIATRIAKGIARVPVAFLTFGMSEAWHQRERTMRSWLGHHESELYMSWGPPHTVLQDGSGGRILVYTENRMDVTPGHATTTSSMTAYGQIYGDQVYIYGQGQGYTTYTPAEVHQWQVYRQFRVDSTGKIVQYSWRGL